MRQCVSCAASLSADGWNCPRCLFTPPVVDGVPLLAPSLAYGNSDDAGYLHDELCAAEDAHFWFRNRSRLIAWAVRRYFPHAESMVDVGCGTGGVLARLRRSVPTMRLLGVDALISGLSLARRRLPDVPLIQLDIRRLPFDTEFDLVGMFDALEHLDDDEGCLRELYRSTTKGGGLIVTVPQHPSLWSEVDEFSHHRRRYTRRQLVRIIERAGYAIVRTTSFMTFTLPAQIAARLRQWRRASFDPAAELRLHPVLNGLLGAACTVERAAVGAGISWPVGGSLLVVARRPT
jgi:SAM-dependent methyltransferase